MKLTIRERGQKVAEQLKHKTQATIASIARATGLTKSSVQRHQQAIRRRNQQSELLWLETEAGYAWLKMLVLGVVYYFGIQRGVGCEQLSSFFRAIRLEAHVGVSSSALRTLKTQMEATILAYEQAQAEHCQASAGIDICVGGDETFFGLPILVMVELASGYIFTEAKSEDRRYQTWHEQIGSWWQQSGWQCHFMVSDRARALVKLALEGLGCVSVADWFHVLRALSQPLGSTLARKTQQISQQIARL